MTIDLSGKVALVTGAAGGLGRAYSLALARAGAAVVVNDLGGDTRGEGASVSLAQAVVDEIVASGGRAIANGDSVATKAGGEAMTRATIDAFGRIDVLVNNAGNQRNALFEDLSEDDIESVMAVHLNGAFYVTQPAYRAMKAQGYGRIILTSSQSGIFGNPYRANYGAAKTAMIGLMNVIAQEAPPGVLINSIFPNATGGRMGTPGETRVDADFLRETGKRFSALRDIMSPEYVAALLVFLASERCTATQGMYSVLGGRYARIAIGLTEGWLSPRGEIPTPEHIADRFGEIEAGSIVVEPRSGLDEMDSVVARLAT